MTYICGITSGVDLYLRWVSRNRTEEQRLQPGRLKCCTICCAMLHFDVCGRLVYASASCGAKVSREAATEVVYDLLQVRYERQCTCDSTIPLVEV